MGSVKKVTLNKGEKGDHSMREIDKAVELLRPLLEGLAKDRDRMVDIYSVCIGEDFIVVAIDNVRYQINVTSENVRSIVRSVVNYVALKF